MKWMKVYLLIRSKCIPAGSAVLARHCVAFFDVIGACLSLESFRAMAFEISARQRNTRATIIARRWCAQILFFTKFTCKCEWLESVWKLVGVERVFVALTGIALCTRAHVVLQWFQMTRSTILTWARFAGIAFGDFAQRSCKSDWASTFECWHRRCVINFANATILTAWSRTGVTWIQVLTKCTHISARATVNERNSRQLVKRLVFMIYSIYSIKIQLLFSAECKSIAVIKTAREEHRSKHLQSLLFDVTRTSCGSSFCFIGQTTL